MHQPSRTTPSTATGANTPRAEGLWQKSATPNLYRYRPSGVYFARAKVGGKLIRQSLQTTTYSVAVLRLNDLLKENRGRVEIREATRTGPMTFEAASEQMLLDVDANPSVKPATREYRRRCLQALVRSWPDLNPMDVRRITPRHCQDWAASFAKRYSPTMYNNTVGTLRMVLDVAVKAGVRFGNPAAEIRKVKVPIKQLRLPSTEQFQRMVRTIAARGGRFSRDCANLVEFLAYGGFRKGEAEHIRWADCDLEKRRILVAGDPQNGTKNGETRWVPMNAAMHDLLKRLQSDRVAEPLSNPIMRVQECQKALERACQELGLERITHHDLRHLFATRCIESGVDVPTVSRWLGHKDGGALAMRVYGHLRDQHSLDMANRVMFGTPVNA